MDKWIADNFVFLIIVILTLTGILCLGAAIGQAEGYREGFKDGIGYCVPTPAKE